MDIAKIVSEYPNGVSAGELEARCGVSRSTLNRHLKDAIDDGSILPVGLGPARIYFDSDPLRSTRKYFERPSHERSVSVFAESMLQPESVFTIENTESIKTVIDKRDLIKFLIDFSCASSIMEGGTYSLLDTQALIEYGEKAEGKPLHDAALVLNHRDAFERMFNLAVKGEEISLKETSDIHRMLTNDHDMQDLKASPHFLESHQSGVVREYEDVRINTTTYLPPFKPGTGYIRNMLSRILSAADMIDDPIESSFYLFTRIPYLQPYCDGNKRLSRVVCNAPLLKRGLPPISFSDFNKKDYLISMMSFYELRDITFAATTFAAAYKKSIDRLGLSGEFNIELKDVTPTQQANMSM